MNDSHKNKNYIIAGGSKGIGLALSQQLLDSGATVHVHSRSIGELAVSENENLSHYVCDFSSDDLELAGLPDEIHGVAYCPGTINLRSFRALKLADFRNDFEINTMGAIKFLKGVQAGLKRGASQQPTSVVLFSTVAVGKGLPMHASVATAKGAIEGLSRALAAELAPHTRVNCLAPALTDTPLAINFFSSDEKRAAMDAKYPLKRSGTPADLASMAAFLLGPDSGWMTGQVLGVDGGMSTIGG